MFVLQEDTANGDRCNVPNYLILISDGQSTVDPEATLPEAILVSTGFSN